MAITRIWLEEPEESPVEFEAVRLEEKSDSFVSCATIEYKAEDEDG